MADRRLPRSVALARARERRTWLPRLLAAGLGLLALLPVGLSALQLAASEQPVAFRAAPGRIVECADGAPCVRVVSAPEAALLATLAAGGGLVMAGAAMGRGRLLRTAVWTAPAVALLLVVVQAAHALAMGGVVAPGLGRPVLVVGSVATAVGWLAWRVDPVARF
ncbi:MAG TPA: hypothetical protein VNX21_05440 [Candidatus Thermoplasmatota archaeon]|nr:hypothetical protein [Candidatus Thermoplasmatota archaeon]